MKENNGALLQVLHGAGGECMGEKHTFTGKPDAAQCEAMSTVPPRTSVVHLAAATVSMSACEAP
jgi:hypothetical protein